MQYVWGLLGVVGLLAIAFLLSENKRRIRWRTVLGALAIQLLFGFIVLKWTAGREVLNAISGGVSSIISYANEGVAFVFGSAIPAAGQGFVFAFQVLSVIVFFSALIAVLYHLHIMQWIIRLIGGGLSRLLGTSKAESLSATANIFVGQIEAPLVIKPYLDRMTRSEMFTVMAGGMASVSGSVMAGYALIGVPLNYLIAASFMAAPAGLLVSKLLIPETEISETSKEVTVQQDDTSANVIDAAARGAVDGVQIAIAVAATLIAFIGLIALVNGLLGGVGSWFGMPTLSLQGILGFLFAPIAFLIGVPWSETILAGSLIGQKIIINEFVAFSELVKIQSQLSDRSFMIAAFALCGFANLSSIAMQISGISAIAPNRRSIITELGFRSVLAGTIANLLSASIAGMFY
ncbi:NupC/NupG family nucleoside CNT transporter [Paenibacillus sp. 481]|uniref:NupC/NupG family nucleoside CNT transporter n=1 Tax=Paenibacillus sp. 481 TaxID=2835869 RepID=UPI001E503FD6|nr:NupC/NupG family nucleoside CNT transporter [Paenibacillus sp. 481]UHA72041.1 NupC/NupG family nucleoside CNT transporter [Paenibacillus sp. 481]